MKGITLYFWFEGMAIGTIIGYSLTRAYDLVQFYIADWKEDEVTRAEYEEIKK